MRLAIFDNNFINKDTADLPVNERAEAIKKLGFTGVHWSYPDFKNEYLNDYKPYGFTAASIDVLARITAADDKVFGEAVEVIYKSLEFCREIGCKNAMIVPCEVSDIDGPEDLPRARERMIEGLKLAVNEAKKYGVRVSIENFSTPKLPFSLVKDIRYILDSVGGLYFTFDTGNFVCVGEDGVNAYNTLKDRIVLIHLKEFGEVDGPGDRVIRRVCDGKYLYGKRFGEGLSKIDAILEMASKDFPDIWYEVEHHYFELGLEDVREIAEYVQSKF